MLDIVEMSLLDIEKGRLYFSPFISGMEVQVLKRRSHWFVFLEGYSSEEELMSSIFTTFDEKHRDTVVSIFRPADQGFEEMRAKLEIRRLPGFSLTDKLVPYLFISFDRGNYLMEKLKDEGREFYELISDIHYSLIDEGLARVSKKMFRARLSYIFGKAWKEVKDLVTISP